MKKVDWNKWIGKRIFIKLKGGLKYSGTVTNYNSEEKILNIKDKFNCDVDISTEDISVCQEKKEGGYG